MTPKALREAVHASDLSLREIGRLSEVDISILSKWLRDPDRGITLDSAERIAGALGYELRLSRKK
jgi:transcriptional regulator with XRE-family HTH domain